MRPVDTRLDQLLGTGAATFRATLDLVPDPVSVLWAIRDAVRAVIDFEIGYANPAMASLFGVSTEQSFGRRLLQESPAYGDEPAFKRMCAVVETGAATVVETVVDRAEPIGRLSGVFMHRAIPFGPDAVMNMLTDITSQRRLETQNLIANSLKFRSTQPPRVTIAAEHADGFWLFTVDDNGVGIPPELGDDAFAMFKRAHGDDYEGCGIGLAVCRKIVEAHGGAIVAARAPGGGTSIRFSLPAVAATAPHAVRSMGS